MAASDASPFPIKNQAYRVYFPILDEDGDLVSAAGALDSERSLDGATFADCTNEATEIATSSGFYYLDLTAAEMNTDCTVVIVKSTLGKTTPIVLYPVTLADAMIGTNLVQISTSATAADNLEASALGIITGSATGTHSTTNVQTDLTGYVTSELIGRVIVFTGGTANGQAATITSYNSTNGDVGFAALTTAPVNSDTFVIV